MRPFLVADSSTPGVDLAPLYQYGAVGVLAMLAIVVAVMLYRKGQEQHDQERTQLLDQLRDQKEQTRSEKERADRLELALAELNRTVREQVMGVLTEAQRAVTDAIARMRK